MISKTVSVSVEATPDAVYDFVVYPENVPKWATAFCRSVEYRDGAWVVETPDGPVRFEFVERNGLGVLDHTATLESWQSFYNPMRVIANGENCEVLFTLFQIPGVEDERFAEDGRLVENDLLMLKPVIEDVKGV